ncbi:MAG: polysaccharide deacetylase family protein, partial [Erysipelotrichaceae bacterium]|nr:polysaccharide deacetylase family protein [Erysipelotrichaceae bacterium]
KSKETDYTGGNVDADGYNRTADAFEKDLEMYYKEGYRMIRLNDYIDGKVDVDAGKSPLILTFDDGHANNILVKGKDENGELEIDPKSAVGILEKFKEKYPDFNVTATFFINQTKFNQPKYDDEIIKWLVKHGYDVGNHTASHPDLTEITQKETNDEVGVVYDLLEEVIPGKYVKIVALPFGSPYQYDHENMKKVYDCKYNGKKYHTKSALQVAWEPDESPYSKKFTPSFLKRIRGYDNGGEYFDIEYTFTLLESTRYISDGDVKTCVVPKDKKDLIDKKFKKQIKTY